MIIRDYLYSHTNNNHCVSAKMIVEHLAAKGIKADRKTIYSDIERLISDYGMNIDIVEGRNGGYKLAEPPFKPSELRLMIDAVQSAKFITEDEAATVTNKIKNLADVYIKPTLDRKSYVHERIRDMGESIVDRTNVIHEAINTDTKLSFMYAHYKPSISIEQQKTYSNNGKPYLVSPFALYWSNGNYYLYAYNSERKKFATYRIDRMEDMKLSSRKREGHEEFRSETFTSTKKAKVFDMFGGEVATVTLRAINKLSNQIIDQFGSSTMLIPEGQEHFTANVRVEVSPTFFAWVSTFGKDMKIINPPEVVEEMKAFIGKVNEMYE